ncbi:Alpha/Beta hydrolase protein [Lophiotrema nucula]|uniref:Alpha/Beta hydrolase protein n=1 Tax=Lophiotrema nucula TaxID=690887 RepID=A0A6A5YP60_9PLEO|nr:Alpha/Beta hydrolase protein [Lophiotrema nucula]
MLFGSLILLLTAVGAISAYSSHSSCRDVQIPVTVSVPRFIINTTVEDNWDAVALSFNLTRRDSGQSSDPLPIVGKTSQSVRSEYKVGVTLCGDERRPVLVLTHGIIESKKYWQPSFKGAERYNFVDAALAAGYSVLNYDRIGVGSSSKIDALRDAQFQVETAVLNSLIAYARQSMKATKVALVGHSYGSYLSGAAANQTAVDAVVLTGFSGYFDNFAPFIAGASFRVAKLKNPSRWGHLEPGYLTSSDLYAETYGYFAEPYFEHRVAEWSYEHQAEPFAIGELPTLLASFDNFNNISAPVLVIQGQFDLPPCGGNCLGQLERTKTVFQKARIIETVDDLPAGHNLNLHACAPQAFRKIFDFLTIQMR